MIEHLRKSETAAQASSSDPVGSMCLVAQKWRSDDTSSGQLARLVRNIEKHGRPNGHTKDNLRVQEQVDVKAATCTIRTLTEATSAQDYGAFASSAWVSD